MGFDPYRGQHRSYADYALMIATLAVCAALVAWAVFG